MSNRSTGFVPAEAFPPGDYLREELEARGKTQADLARVLGRPLQTVNQIVNGHKGHYAADGDRARAALLV